MTRTATLRRTDAVRHEPAPAEVVPLELFRQCVECKQELPLRSFLPSPHHPGGRVPTCTPCIRARAERDRLDRERRHAEAVARAAEAGRKRCRTCKVEKAVSEFSRHRLSRDGFRHDCRDCVRANKAKTKSKPETPEQVERRRQWAADPEARVRNRVAVARWTELHPQAVHARTQLRLAVRRGAVTPAPCCQIEGCDGVPVEGHHCDYSKPLQVLWTCRAHHRRLHNGARLKVKPGVDQRLARIPPKYGKRKKSSRKRSDKFRAEDHTHAQA